MQIIKLTKGQVAIVDDEDFEELNQYKWYAHKTGNTFYAGRNVKGLNRTTMHMHQTIMNAPEGADIDHINGDGLNNLKSNLRIVTHRQNTQNRHATKSSIYPGVGWCKKDKKWRAYITINGKDKHLGNFGVEADAYAAYLKALEGIGETCVNEIIKEGEIDAA